MTRPRPKNRRQLRKLARMALGYGASFMWVERNIGLPRLQVVRIWRYLMRRERRLEAAEPTLLFPSRPARRPA